MFEVGFSEIILILGLALLVLGPEKLPGLAEKVGRWTGRARSMARQLRTQLEQEVTIEQMAKSKPMHAPPPAPETHVAEEPPPVSMNSPSMDTPSTPPSTNSPDPHFNDIDTSPEAMHGKPQKSVET